MEIYTENIPKDGDYKGLYNRMAVLAPYNWQRWANGFVVPGLFIAGAHMAKNPMLRSAAQMFGFGYGMRVLGAGLAKLVAVKAFPSQEMSQRLYSGEFSAAQTQAQQQGTTWTGPSLQYTGLAAPQLRRSGVGGCGCSNCSTGLGICCGAMAQSATPTTPPSGFNPGPYPPPPPPPPPPPGQPQGIPAGTQGTPSSPTGYVDPASQGSTPQYVTPQTPRGLPTPPGKPFGMSAAPSVAKNPWSWGYSEDSAAE